MIVQFLNGKQLDVSHLPFGQISEYILSLQGELEIEILLTVQIKLLQSETDPSLWYAFIKSLSEVEYDSAMMAISELPEREERYRVISVYHQQMANERFFTYFFTKNHSYRLFSANGEELFGSVYRFVFMSKEEFEEFNHPHVENSSEPESIEEGQRVYNHWVEVEGEEFAISTIVSSDMLYVSGR